MIKKRRGREGRGWDQQKKKKKEKYSNQVSRNLLTNTEGGEWESTRLEPCQGAGRRERKWGGGQVGRGREGKETQRGERGGGLINCSTAIRSSLAPGREWKEGWTLPFTPADPGGRLPVYQRSTCPPPHPPSAVLFHPLHITSDWYTIHHSP